MNKFQISLFGFIRLSSMCKFGISFSMNIMGYFVCGLNNGSIQKNVSENMPLGNVLKWPRPWNWRYWHEKVIIEILSTYTKCLWRVSGLRNFMKIWKGLFWMRRKMAQTAYTVSSMGQKLFCQNKYQFWRQCKNRKRAKPLIPWKSKTQKI